MQILCIYTFCFAYAKTACGGIKPPNIFNMYGFYVKFAQNTRQSVEGCSQKVKTNKYSQKGVDNEYLCEYNTDIANDQ